MRIKQNQSFGVGILALIVWSSAACADPAGDVALGRKALVREDLPEAVKLFRKAAEQNYLPAQVELGDLQHSQQELEEAFGWYMTAAYQGDAAAAFDMGQMYAIGEGVEKNLEKAQYWIKVAAGKNFLSAQEVLVTAYKTGELGLAIDPEQAKHWESKVTALRAVEARKIDKEIAARQAVIRAANQEFIKDAAEKDTAAIKAVDEAAEKKVDDADR